MSSSDSTSSGDRIRDAQEDERPHLFDRMGGDAILKGVVEDLYNKVTSDERLKPFFEGVSMSTLRRHQRGFLKVAFTTIPELIDIRLLLLKKHERLFAEMGLNETHFDMFLAYLVEAMEDRGVEQSLVDEALGIINSLRGVFEAGARDRASSHVKILTPNNFVATMSDEGPAQALLRMLRYSSIKFLRFLVVDACNNIRAKAVPIDRCTTETVVTFAKVCFAGLPVYADIVIPGTGFDARDLLVVRPDFGTLRILPYNPKSAVVLGTAHAGDELSSLCARGLLSRVVETAQAEHGIIFNVGAEIEFTLCEADTGEFVDESLFSNSTTLTQQEEYISDLYDQLKKQGIDVELIHAESGPGQLEVVLQYLPNAVKLVDSVVLARETIQQVARVHGFKALFLPKILLDRAGNGLHLHLSFSAGNVKAKGDTISLDGSGAGTTDSMSATNTEDNYFAREGQSFVEGILRHLPALLAVTIPSVNSFRRIKQGCWTGYLVGWAVEDKEAPLRLCRDVDTGFLSNVEMKLSDSTANLYMSLACVLACGLNGTANKMKLRPALNLQQGAPLPATFGEALDELEKDLFLVEEVLGEELSRGYITLRRAEIERSAGVSIDDEVSEALRRA